MPAELDRLNASFAGLKTSVEAALAKVNTGIDPAALTPVADGMDALKAEVDAVLTPPAAPAAPPTA